MENHTVRVEPSLKPPDINPIQSNDLISFKEKLLANDHERSFSLSPLPSYLLPMAIDSIEVEEEKTSKDQDIEHLVPITGKDQQRIYYPRRFSIIIKLQGKKTFTELSNVK